MNVIETCVSAVSENSISVNNIKTVQNQSTNSIFSILKVVDILPLKIVGILQKFLLNKMTS